MRRVRALADHDHAVMMKHHHFAAISLFKHGGIEDSVRTAFGDQAPVQTNGPGKVGGHPIQIVGGNDDGNPAVIDLVQEVNHIVARANIESGGGLVEQDQLRIA